METNNSRLNLDETYGVIYGLSSVPNAKYTQHGNFYDAHGALICAQDATPPDPKTLPREQLKDNSSRASKSANRKELEARELGDFVKWLHTRDTATLREYASDNSINVSTGTPVAVLRDKLIREWLLRL